MTHEGCRAFWSKRAEMSSLVMGAASVLFVDLNCEARFVSSRDRKFNSEMPTSLFRSHPSSIVRLVVILMLMLLMFVVDVIYFIVMLEFFFLSAENNVGTKKNNTQQNSALCLVENPHRKKKTSIQQTEQAKQPTKKP